MRPTLPSVNCKYCGVSSRFVRVLVIFTGDRERDYDRDCELATIKFSVVL